MSWYGRSGRGVVLAVIMLLGAAWSPAEGLPSAAGAVSPAYTALTLAFREDSLTPGLNEHRQVDRVVVRKRARMLLLMKDDSPIRVYNIALGDDPIGHKRYEGDERTPEGEYVLDWRNPNSRFYKSIHISYPNEADRAYAEARGESPGGMIMIHGWPSEPSPRFPLERLTRSDWTDGCIAVTNGAMDEIWELVADGTPIEIHP